MTHGSSAKVDRLVIHAPGDAAAGARLAEGLPAALTQAFTGARASDERTIRRLIDLAVRRALR